MLYDKLAEQGLHMNRELRGNHRRVARGEYPLYVPFTLPDILDLEGLPLKAIIPTEGAPHPNAARLLVDFFLSEEVQTIFANVGYPPVIGGLEGKVNPEARPLIQAKLLGTTDPTLQDDMLKLAKQIYK